MVGGVSDFVLEGFERSEGDGRVVGGSGGGEGDLELGENGFESVRVLSHELEDTHGATTDVARGRGVVVEFGVVDEVVDEGRGDKVVLEGDGNDPSLVEGRRFCEEKLSVDAVRKGTMDVPV